jgi:formate dehydrogenase major subunit
VWNWLDPVPVHREPLHTPRPDLLSRFATYEDQAHHFRLSTRYRGEQRSDWVKDYPIVLITGQMTESSGGGARTRSNRYLAEYHPEMFAEVNAATAREYGLADGEFMWVEGPDGGRARVKAKISARVDAGVLFLPYSFAGHMDGQSRAAGYPEGTTPYILGEPGNLVVNYGYDIITQMQESKTGLCRIRKA